MAVAFLSLLAPSALLAQTLKPLAHQPPDGAGICFQLTDGNVLCQGNGESDWYRLSPDVNGSYLNGTWTKVGSLQAGYVPDAFASAVLADGRVVIVGGEYNNNQFTLTNQGAVYSPATGTWTPLKPPSFWPFIGDSPSAVLPNGKFMVGNKLLTTSAVLDPLTLTWSMVGTAGKSDFNAEEGWTLLPDGSIFTFDVKNAPNAERYIPTAQRWINAGNTIVDLHSPSPFGCLTYGNNRCYFPPGEVGPAILRPDGTVFAAGSTPMNENTAHTAIYTPPDTIRGTGSWTVGPDFPRGDEAGDSFAALLTNGNVLVLGVTGRLYEFDGTNLNAGPSASGALMVLPTGEVLVTSFPAQLYTSSGTYNPAWAPAITSVPTSVTRGSTYKISGTQFNGLSQAAAFGDEFETATNYPLVRLTNQSTGHVFYARTHDHSTMGVATGSKIVSTNFDVPAGAESGATTLEVVANGIPSPPVTVTVN
ncbi:MAG: hypothetical protein H0X25_16970 [Acidobacteriales bacterium]|nr:hypothetical protein [Terriglobales bacterium]